MKSPAAWIACGEHRYPVLAAAAAAAAAVAGAAVAAAAAAAAAAATASAAVAHRWGRYVNKVAPVAHSLVNLVELPPAINRAPSVAVMQLAPLRPALPRPAPAELSCISFFILAVTRFSSSAFLRYREFPLRHAH